MFAGDIGIPYILRSDMVLELMVKHTEFQSQVKSLFADLTQSEVERSNQNHAVEGGMDI